MNYCVQQQLEKTCPQMFSFMYIRLTVCKLGFKKVKLNLILNTDGSI